MPEQSCQSCHLPLYRKLQLLPLKSFKAILFFENFYNECFALLEDLILSGSFRQLKSLNAKIQKKAFKVFLLKIFKYGEGVLSLVFCTVKCALYVRQIKTGFYQFSWFTVASARLDTETCVESTTSGFLNRHFV